MKTLNEILKEFRPKKLPSGQIRMMCPFREHHDKLSQGLESMFLTPEKNIYHCFSCSSAGHLTGLLTTKFDVSFSDALELVNSDNIDYILKADSKEKSEEFELDFIIPIKAPKKYVERGFNARLLRMFNVGEDDGVIYTPILDNEGMRIVGIKCRKGRNFWYLPEGFDKSSYLYNFHRCKGKQKIILVEGETDVYQSCRWGIYEVCATLGGQLSEEQAKAIIDEESIEEVVLAFDHDMTGLKDIEVANYRLSPYKRVSIMQYESQDPGCSEKDEWRDGFEDNNVPYSVYSTMMALEMEDEYLAHKKQWLKKLKQNENNY